MTPTHPSRKPLAVLTDFDGTLTQNDVGVLLLDAFASSDWRNEGELWRNGLIRTFKEMNEREFSYLPARRRAEMVRFALDIVKLREGALELVKYCDKSSIPLEIVSSGLDYYIQPILNHHGLGSLPVLCMKHADFSGGGRIVPTYAKGMVVCDITGACKCSRVWHYQALGHEVVYVGDGSSDRCPAGQANVLFARDKLALYCEEKGILYRQFETFLDVLAVLEQMTENPSSL